MALLLSLEVGREGSDETSTRRIGNEWSHRLESGDYVFVIASCLTADGELVQIGTSKEVDTLGGAGRT